MSYFLADILPELGMLTVTRDSTVTMLSRQFARAVSARILDADAESGGLSLVDRAPFNDVIQVAGLRCWGPEIACASEFARRGSSAAPFAQAQLALALAQLGAQGAFEFLLPYPDRLLIGPSRPRCAGRLRLNVQPNRITLETDDDRFEYVLAGGTWLSAASPPAMVERSAIAEIAYFAGYAVDPEILMDEDCALSPERFTRAIADVEAALQIVQAAGLAAFAWVTRLIRVMSIVASEEGTRLSSRTLPARAGNIEIAAPGNRLHLAELLIHEAAHQHFHLGALLGPYVTAQAQGLRFLSALNGRLRPLDRVALAFHAVGNIFVFLESLVEKGGPIGEDAGLRLVELGPTASSLVETMRAQANLFTENGRNLLDELIEQTERIISSFALPAEPAAERMVRGVNAPMAIS